MIARETLIDRIRHRLEIREEIQDAYLFGSHARGEATDHSDVDIAVYVHPLPDTPYGYDAALAADLMPVTGNNVDVLLLNTAPPVVYHRVLRDGIRVLARDLRATTVREGRALSRYCDYVPQLEKIARGAGRRIAEGTFGR